MPAPHKIGPIARKLLNRFKKSHPQKVVNLQLWRQAQAEFDGIATDIASRVNGDPEKFAFDLYNFVQNCAMGIMEMMLELPEMDKLMTRIDNAWDEYMPSYPPMSPITGTFFWTWVLMILFTMHGGRRLRKFYWPWGMNLPCPPSFWRRWRFYPNPGWVSGTLYTCDTGSGYEGVAGELWLARVLPPPMPGMVYSLIFTTPCVVQYPDLEQWQAWLQRTLPKTKQADPQAAYACLMKGCLAPNYLTEFVFEAYTGDIR